MKKKHVFVVLMVLVLSLSSMVFAAGASESQTSTGEVQLVKSADVIVPAKPGGGTDLMARAMFTAVTKASGSNFGIVNNETGNAIVAMEEVRTAKPDGSKVLFYNGGFMTRIAAGIYKHSVDEFTVLGVGHGVDPAYALLVAADSGIKDINDLIARAKAEPGKLLFGCNIGGTTQVMGVQLAEALGVDFKFVASGADTATLTELVGHNINVCYANINQARQYVESGKAIALGVLGQDKKGDRSPVLKEVPSMVELGYPLSFGVYVIVLGPAGMDSELATKLHDYIAAAAVDPEVVKLLNPAGLNVQFVPFEEGIQLLKEEQNAYSSIFQKYGLAK